MFCFVWEETYFWIHHGRHIARKHQAESRKSSFMRCGNIIFMNSCPLRLCKLLKKNFWAFKNKCIKIFGLWTLEVTDNENWKGKYCEESGCRVHAQVHLCLHCIIFRMSFCRCHGCCIGICCNWSVHKFILALESPLWGRPSTLLSNNNSVIVVVAKQCFTESLYANLKSMLLHFEIS